MNWPGVYFAITSLLLIFLFFKIIRVLRFFKDAIPKGDVLVKTSPTEESFSFFKFIHLRAHMNDNEEQIVWQHEMIHYQKRHSLDLLVLEVFHSLFWINPLFFYVKKELVNIHEFEVDQEMYQTHKKDYMRHLLSYALGSVDSHYLLTSPFYNRLTITKRIQIMKNNKNSNNIWLLLTIPALAIALTTISCENQAIKEEPIKNYSQILQDQKDAGVAHAISELNKQPEFKGGIEKMYTFLGENINYPESAKNENIEGRVFINFIVTETGKIEDATILKGVNDAIDAEALRVINAMPNWEPAKKDNVPVKVAFNLPIVFKLN